MKTAILTIALALTAAPAFALDFPIFLGHRDPEYRGYITHWPAVRQARDRERLCLAQQLAIAAQDKMRLELAMPALYGPAFGVADRTATTAPPPPTAPSAPPAPTPR